MVKRLRNYNPDSAKIALDRFVVSEEASGEWRAFCPVCEDPDKSTTPSASFNFGNDVWYCQSMCSSKKGIYWKISALIPLLKEKGFDYRSELQRNKAKIRNANDNPLMKHNVEKSTGKSDKLTEENVSSWERRLHSSAPILSQLMSKRGFDEDTLRRFQIGWDGQRFTIPIRDEDGVLRNVRRYKMDADGSNKMYNIPGCGEARLYGLDSLKKYDEIVLAEGETDRILAEQHGIPCVTHTAGAATFREAWGPLFSGKTVYICYDNDDKGRQGATKAGKILSAYADHVYQISIPIPTKGADITDYIHNEGHSGEDFRGLMRAARPMNPTKTVEVEEAPLTGTPVSLEASKAEDVQGETLEMVVQVAGKSTLFETPARFSVTCDQNKGAVCETCPVALRDGEMDVQIARNDVRLFKFVGVADEKKPKLMKDISGARCTDRAKFEVEEIYNVEELVVGNSVEDRKHFESDKPVTRQVFSVSTHGTEVNTSIKIIGTNVASPRDQKKMFMAWHNEPIKTSLDSFVLSDDMRKELDAFRVNLNDPDNSESPLDRCLKIAKDIAQHQTRIYGRDLLHVAYDLVWHSPLTFEVEGRLIEKGWLECMVIGDTRTGKSETAIQLSKHYQAGIVKSCEGATFAGLVGGVQQPGGSNSWITTWGVIPLNDRRLVVLDEASGLKEKDVIENMSSIRSSGTAQITKIDTQETSARTRLIWITNPADGAQLDERPNQGIDAMRTVVKNQEDVARFDFVMAARASEVDPDDINRTHDITSEPRYNSEMCSNLVLWAWSLRPDQIRFDDSAVAAAREIARNIGDEYVADPPLLQAENVRFKLYRLAAAIAARTFHIEWPEKGEMELVVYGDHVRDAKRFLDMVYGVNGGMGYRVMSKGIINARKRATQFRVAAKSYLLEHRDTVWRALQASSHSSAFRQRDFEEFGGLNKEDASRAVGHLLDMGMIHRKTQGYITMDRVLVSILRELEDEEDF